MRQLFLLQVQRLNRLLVSVSGHKRFCALLTMVG